MSSAGSTACPAGAEGAGQELLTRFGVWDLRRRTMEGLSAGQTTRVMLAKAFLARPRVALLDEPTASLDPDIADEVRDFVREQRDEEGVSIVFTSHNMDEVAQVCDRVIFLDRGRIAAVGRPRSWRPRPPRRGSGSASSTGLDELLRSAAAWGLAAHSRTRRSRSRSTSSTSPTSSRSSPRRRSVHRDRAPQADARGLLPQAGPAQPGGQRRSIRPRPARSRRQREARRLMKLHRIIAMIMRHLYLFPRTLERWAEAIYWPVLDLVLWGLTSHWVESSGSEVPQLALIVLTGVVFWQVVWRANYEISVNLLEEFWNQNLVNLFATPLSVWEWSVSLVVLGLIKNVLTLVVGVGASGCSTG